MPWLVALPRRPLEQVEQAACQHSGTGEGGFFAGLVGRFDPNGRYDPSHWVAAGSAAARRGAVGAGSGVPRFGQEGGQEGSGGGGAGSCRRRPPLRSARSGPRSGRSAPPPGTSPCRPTPHDRRRRGARHPAEAGCGPPPERPRHSETARHATTRHDTPPLTPPRSAPRRAEGGSGRSGAPEARRASDRRARRGGAGASRRGGGARCRRRPRPRG